MLHLLMEQIYLLNRNKENLKIQKGHFKRLKHT